MTEQELLEDRVRPLKSRSKPSAIGCQAKPSGPSKP